jgi:hypothetical protein
MKGQKVDNQKKISMMIIENMLLSFLRKNIKYDIKYSSIK